MTRLVHSGDPPGGIEQAGAIRVIAYRPQNRADGLLDDRHVNFPRNRRTVSRWHNTGVSIVTIMSVQPSDPFHWSVDYSMHHDCCSSFLVPCFAVDDTNCGVRAL